MTFPILFRLALLVLFAAILAYTLCKIDQLERAEVLPRTQERYQPYWGNFALPVVVVAYFLVDVTILPPRQVWLRLISDSAIIFFHATVYFVVLMLLLPWLRRHISARTCGFLWLVPNYLYLSIYLDAFRLDRPALVLRPPVGLLPLLAGIWTVGILVVLGWSIVSHLRFRRRILRGAMPESDPTVLEIYQEELRHAGCRNTTYPLVRSPEVQTPLSIGFWKKTIRVVLPERRYTPQDLSLVLRHELVHIGRHDAYNKLFLTICTALCWFNPLMWIAMRRSAEDFELSCDETVLLDADSPTRRRYAELLLTTAGEERGFTTCLSASANSLRYRLKAVMSPVRRSRGALVMTAAILLLTLPFGAVTFAWNSATAEEKIFAGDTSACTVSRFSYFDAAGEQTYASEFPDPEPLLELLGRLPVDELAGMYQLSTTSDPALCLSCTIDGADTYLVFTENSLSVSHHNIAQPRLVYYLPQPPDWDAIEDLLPKA